MEAPYTFLLPNPVNPTESPTIVILLEIDITANQRKFTF